MARHNKSLACLSKNRQNVAPTFATMQVAIISLLFALAAAGTGVGAWPTTNWAAAGVEERFATDIEPDVSAPAEWKDPAHAPEPDAGMRLKLDEPAGLSPPDGDPARSLGVGASNALRSLFDADAHIAIYDIGAHTVYLPNGARLEAHSGLGRYVDDVRYISARDRGPTPPNVYGLSLREHLFHGVRAIRLTPVGAGDMFGRDGILAHSYMLGPNGQSNGCVAFTDYPAFLDAFLAGEITRLIVVEHLDSPPYPKTASEASTRSPVQKTVMNAKPDIFKSFRRRTRPSHIRSRISRLSKSARSRA
jgi:hypothetical protein